MVYNVAGFASAPSRWKSQWVAITSVSLPLMAACFNWSSSDSSCFEISTLAAKSQRTSANGSFCGIIADIFWDTAVSRYYLGACNKRRLGRLRVNFRLMEVIFQRTSGAGHACQGTRRSVRFRQSACGRFGASIISQHGHGGVGVNR